MAKLKTHYDDTRKAMLLRQRGPCETNSLGVLDADDQIFLMLGSGPREMRHDKAKEGR